MEDPLYARYIASLRMKARENPNGLPPVVWVCSLCHLGSFQRTEDAYLRHLEQLHPTQMEEMRQDPSVDFEAYKAELIRKAFATPKMAQNDNGCKSPDTGGGQGATSFGSALDLNRLSLSNQREPSKPTASPGEVLTLTPPLPPGTTANQSPHVGDRQSMSVDDSTRVPSAWSGSAWYQRLPAPGRQSPRQRNIRPAPPQPSMDPDFRRHTFQNQPVSRELYNPADEEIREAKRKSPITTAILSYSPRPQQQQQPTSGQRGVIEIPADSRYPNLILQPDSRAVSPEQFQSKDEVRVYEIPGLIANYSVNALGDYGAKKNFMRESYAVKLGLKIDRGLIRKIAVGSGNMVTSTGAAIASFHFEGERKMHELIFHLLPNCIHDVILGKPFLKTTETLSQISNFTRRVKERIVKGISQFRLLYLGESSPKFEGFINDKPQSALADTGAKIPVLDEKYARSVGLDIKTGSEHRAILRFADNSTAYTSGMVYGVEWKFGREDESTSPYQLDFHVLKNAPSSVILPDTLLLGENTFAKYQHFLIDDDDDNDDDDDDNDCFFAIDRVLEQQNQDNATSTSVAKQEHFEVIRRGEAEDMIANLPKAEQAAAWVVEHQLRGHWDQKLPSLRRTQIQLEQTVPAPAYDPTPVQPIVTGPTVQSLGSATQRCLKWPWPGRSKRGKIVARADGVSVAIAAVGTARPSVQLQQFLQLMPPSSNTDATSLSAA